MSVKLPGFVNETDYKAHFHAPIWREVAAEICLRHRIKYQQLQRAAMGENIIFFIDQQYVIKIFAPFRSSYRREKISLHFATKKTDIETPEIVYTGDIEGWSYLVLTQLKGIPAKEVWPTVPHHQRIAIVRKLATTLKQLHRYSPPQEQLLALDWPQFLEKQVAESVERQRSCGANPQWLDRLPSYIAERFDLLPSSQQPVFLHGDVHLGNLMLIERKGEWVLQGLFDFGDSLVGFHEYDFVPPGVIMIQGEWELQREFLLAYGYQQSQLGEALRDRLMLLTILYECSDLRKYATRLRPEAIHYSLDELAAAIWVFAND